MNWNGHCRRIRHGGLASVKRTHPYLSASCFLVFLRAHLKGLARSRQLQTRTTDKAMAASTKHHLTDGDFVQCLR